MNILIPTYIKIIPLSISNKLYFIYIINNGMSRDCITMSSGWSKSSEIPTFYL